MSRTKEFDELQVLDKALRIFWCKGYNGTSMQDLIDGVGISRSSLYDTYGDKRALYLAALKKYQHDEARALIEDLDRSTNVLQTIRDIFRSVIDESVADDQKKGCFFINSSIDVGSQDREISLILNTAQKEVEDAYYKALKKGQQNGDINSQHSARAMARFVMNAAAGIRVNARTTRDKKAFEDIMHLVLALLTPHS